MQGRRRQRQRDHAATRHGARDDVEPTRIHVDLLVQRRVRRRCTARTTGHRAAAGDRLVQQPEKTEVAGGPAAARGTVAGTSAASGGEGTASGGTTKSNAGTSAAWSTTGFGTAAAGAHSSAQRRSDTPRSGQHSCSAATPCVAAVCVGTADSRYAGSSRHPARAAFPCANTSAASSSHAQRRRAPRWWQLALLACMRSVGRSGVRRIAAFSHGGVMMRLRIFVGDQG